MQTEINNGKGKEGAFFSALIIKLRGDPASTHSYKEKPAWPFFNHAACHDKLGQQYPGVYISKLFTSVTHKKIKSLLNRAVKADPNYQPADLLAYYYITLPREIDPYNVLRFLLKQDWVELAYIQGKTDPPLFRTTEYRTDPQQEYLNASPQGIDAVYAWKAKGGTGKGKVKMIDIEQGWELNNGSLNIKTCPLTGFLDENARDHGTAVLSVIMLKESNTGRSGITPDVKGYVISQWRPDGSPNEADAILAAISYLNCGDILLLEMQSYHAGTGSRLWPIEIQEACFDVIRLATALGIIVIEPAGNGDLSDGKGNDLDFFEVKGKKTLYPYTKDFKDSGAILVSAATSQAPHNRIQYSNYGSRVNCYAWGEGIATIQSTPPSAAPVQHSFAGRLNGTSGAAAIIAGAAISIQCIAEANRRTRLTPEQMKNVFSSHEYGTPSANERQHDKIGSMPDLKKIINTFFKIIC